MQPPFHRVGRLLFAIVMVVAVTMLGRVVGFESPWFALVGSFSLLGLLDLAAPVFPMRLPRRLYELRPWETRGEVYRLLGVRAFGNLLRRSPLRLLNRRVYFRDFSRNPTETQRQLEQAEAAHFWGALATMPYLAVAALQGWWSAVLCLLLFDFTTNLYPLLHLRWARARLGRAFLSKQSSARGGSQRHR